MKWITISLLTTFFASAQANETHSLEMTKAILPSEIAFDSPTVHAEFSYFTLGLGPCPIPLPVFGAGYRYQEGHNGFDASVTTVTAISVTGLKVNALYQYYFKPNLSSQFYVGVGPSIGALFGGPSAFLFSPQVTLGKQYSNETKDTRFLQVEIDWPTLTQSKRFHLLEMPLVIFKYGMGF